MDGMNGAALRLDHGTTTNAKRRTPRRDAAGRFVAANDDANPAPLLRAEPAARFPTSARGERETRTERKLRRKAARKPISWARIVGKAIDGLLIFTIAAMVCGILAFVTHAAHVNVFGEWHDYAHSNQSEPVWHWLVSFIIGLFALWMIALGLFAVASAEGSTGSIVGSTSAHGRSQFSGLPGVSGSGIWQP